MYLGDLKNEELSFIYFGDVIVLAAERPVFKVFQAPFAGDPTLPTPSFLGSPTLTPYDLLA